MDDRAGDGPWAHVGGPVTLLLDPTLVGRRRAAVGGPLAPLAASLAGELEPLLSTVPVLPREKPQLTRAGGRCPRDGSALDFDPWAPRRHHCSRCGDVVTGTAHDRAWITWYQLWLAERAVHSSVLHLLCGDDRHARFACALLEQYADAYLSYPNADNVLGPTRMFFSTYLESIWLLQVCVALSALEHSGGRSLSTTVAARVRERVIAPSSALIASYDEGASNRQVWNSAALLAAATLLGDAAAADRAIHGPSGITSHLSHGLLSDGSWYEGDNYHLFAHRGLWYGVTMAERVGCVFSDALRGRFAEGFATPFATALPDFTFPARRDSQYAVSLRQWRYAELAELGLGRGDDGRLLSALATMYADDLPTGDTERWRSTADAERNVAPSRLGRGDLGWRALLHARPVLPPLEPIPPRSLLMEGQGLAVFRRDAGRLYVALDYGHSGGGHGHPDRLNVLLSDRATRWLDDPGTGAYVDHSLHWYRSTLAHTAPLANGHSQRRVHGTLLAYDERGGVGWVAAMASGIAPGVDACRSLVVMPDYVVDELTWVGAPGAYVDLPLHVDGDLSPVSEWKSGALHGGMGVEDGFPFLSATEFAVAGAAVLRLRARGTPGDDLDLWCVSSDASAWWRAVCPGAPGLAPARMHLLRMTGGSGKVTLVWCPRGGVADVHRAGERTVVTLGDGSRHVHAATADGWRVDLGANHGRGSIDLGGRRGASSRRSENAGPSSASDNKPEARRTLRARRITEIGPLDDAAVADAVTLGAAHYRRSEMTWEEAGCPTAFVAVGVRRDVLIIDVHVEKETLVLAGLTATDVLDNEPPDINVDGFQAYVTTAGPLQGGGGAWLAVPEAEQRLRVTPVDGWPATCVLSGEWRTTSRGFAARLVVRGGSPDATSWRLDLIVNETTPDRSRRRGQLLLSGSLGEFVYLRGDRHDEHRLLSVVVVDE